MGGGSHVGVDPTVSSVSSSSVLGGSVGLAVGDDQRVHVQRVGFGVGLGVDEQVQDGLGSLLGPSALGTGGLHVLALSVSADGTGVLGEGHGLLVGEHVSKEPLGLEETHATDGGHDLSALLVVHSHARGTRLGGCKRRKGGKARKKA